MLDNIKLAHCGKISLRFGGEAFQKTYFLEDYAKKPVDFFRNVTQAEAEIISSNYHVSEQRVLEWQIPTLGQVQFAMENGYVEEHSGNWYWFWNTETNRLDKLKYNSPVGGNSHAGKAHFERMATADFPSACEQSECNFYKEMVTKAFYVGVHSSNPILNSMKYRICATFLDGSSRCVNERAGIGGNHYFEPAKSAIFSYCTKETTGCYADIKIDLSVMKWGDSIPTFCFVSYGDSTKTWVESFYLSELNCKGF